MQAVLCPVCFGKGTLADPDGPGRTASSFKTCHGCNGKGWVEVGDFQYSAWPIYPIYPWPNWLPTYPTIGIARTIDTKSAIKVGEKHE